MTVSHHSFDIKALNYSVDTDSYFRFMPKFSASILVRVAAAAAAEYWYCTSKFALRVVHLITS